MRGGVRFSLRRRAAQGGRRLLGRHVARRCGDGGDGVRTAAVAFRTGAGQGTGRKGSRGMLVTECRGCRGHKKHEEHERATSRHHVRLLKKKKR